ncbi:response regulator [Patescibacteria group bacterium]|nr:response regulator [Patescibacteria group bacterium]MBU1721166.1 response regulator [Patescibacteria group bacterium]MBU1900904.1 response regulator [Patescibacteria group bacterium]
MEEKTVLVIEDEIPLQNAIRIKLEKSNFRVITSRTIKEAMNHLKDVEDIDVIWLDHYLVGKDTGLEFIKQMKKHKEFKHLPIFAISNTASEEKIEEYKKLGVEKFYTKSNFRLDQIITDMQSCLEK